MIQSMTGFAAASADTPRGRLAVELRSVNARFLDLQFRIADELRATEPLLRELLQARLARGKVDCRVFLADDAAGTGGRLSADAIARLRELSAQVLKEMPQAAPLRVGDVLRWPGVIVESPLDEEQTRRLAADVCAHALDELVASRNREGAVRSVPVGKRIDFLAQELNREANTLASKAASQEISDCALELKLLVEQMREQVQNIE